ncbi:hypothetical protein BH23VER1_BH23VER1_30930 [soil metagenome]
MAGIELLAFAVMPNHFHALVYIPERAAAESEVTDAILFDRLGAVYREEQVFKLRSELEDLRRSNMVEEIEVFRRRFLDRMHDLSVFVKEVKARFSTWYNQANGRSGPLWEDRFRSVLLEGDDPSLVLLVATYIDLNPVRAGLAEDPKDYRHCGYAGAVAGDRSRAAMIARLLEVDAKSRGELEEALAHYRMLLFGNALSSDGTLPGDGRRRGGVPVAKVRAVMESGGHLPKLELLRCRIRYLTNSLALGSYGFLEALFPGKAKLPKKADLGDLAVLRDLRGPAVFDANGPVDPPVTESGRKKDCARQTEGA